MNDTTFEEIVLEVLNWYYEDLELYPEDAAVFKNTPKEELSKFNSSLGRSIRNEFKLWEYKWVPDIIDGCDYSPNHPDNVSINILTEVWNRVQ